MSKTLPTTKISVCKANIYQRAANVLYILVAV